MYSETPLPHRAVLWRSAGSTGAIVPADGCVDLILREGRVLVAGPSTRWIQTLHDGGQTTHGLRLPPGSASGVLHLELAELADRLVPLDELLTPARAHGLREAMLGAERGGDATDRLRSITEGAAADDGWSRLVQRSAAAAFSATRVAAELDVSERTFRRHTLAAFGYGYATLVRIERARRAQALLVQGLSVAEAAATAGFADQPHLSREFRRLVGASPAQFAGSAAKRSTELPSGSSRAA